MRPVRSWSSKSTASAQSSGLSLMARHSELLW